jgi:ArsR family transcriptional regulator
MPRRRQVRSAHAAAVRCDAQGGLCCGPVAAPVAGDVGPAVRVLRALADPTRLGILALLVHHGTLCVCHIVEAFPLGQPTISHHLRLLREAGLIACARRGTWCYYRVLPAARPVVAWALALPATVGRLEPGGAPRGAAAS